MWLDLVAEFISTEKVYTFSSINKGSEFSQKGLKRTTSTAKLIGLQSLRGQFEAGEPQKGHDHPLYQSLLKLRGIRRKLYTSL